MLPQILENDKFLTALVNYLSNPEIKKLSGDAYCLFREIYEENKFLNKITKDFIFSAFESFDIILLENDLNEFVKLLTKLNKHEKINKFISEVFLIHDNASKLVNYLLFLLNKEKNDKEVIFKICKLISDLMDLTDSSLFYKTDLDSFISISIQTLESTYTDQLRYHFLNILAKITSYKDYFESKYKLDLLIDLLENYQMSDQVDDKNKDLCTKILMNITNNSN